MAYNSGKEVGAYSLDDDTPSEDGRKRGISTCDVVDDGSGVQTELRTEISTCHKPGPRAGEGGGDVRGRQ